MEPRQRSLLRLLLRGVVVAVGAAGLTLTLFLVLPLLQAIADRPQPDTDLTDMDTGALPPPPPPPVEEEEPEPEEVEEETPELMEEAPPPDLAQLELALSGDGGGGSGWGGSFTLDISKLGRKKGGDMGDMTLMRDMDQKPRVIYRPTPTVPTKLRKLAPATVHVSFVVNVKGRVEDAKVLESTNAMFDALAVKEVKKWKFEPGKSEGRPVPFRMKVPFTVPKS